MLVSDIGAVLAAAEEAEAGLSYTSPCRSEQARKLSGSYYTPVDVTRFFWNQFFGLRGIQTAESAADLIASHRFVEPSVGAGALFFGLLEKLLALGVPPSKVAGINADLVDINGEALGFVQAQLKALERAWGVSFAGIALRREDFLAASFAPDSRPPLVFGNPPFVASQPGARWRNIFANFLEAALGMAGAAGSVQLILPLSLTFSRNYMALRNRLRAHRGVVALSNFDNIPDTLFKSGKPNHGNTNKANSQRCTILTAFPAAQRRVLSTRLHRWPRRERARVLSAAPDFVDVTRYAGDGQFPRPAGARILRYLAAAQQSDGLGARIAPGGKFALHVAGVARNYISIREEAGPGVHTLAFGSRQDFFKALMVLGSDLFLEYWLTLGDGFHLTKGNIHSFPIHGDLESRLDAGLPAAAAVWQNRYRYQKSKWNAGKEMRSYDLSAAFPSLHPPRRRSAPSPAPQAGGLQRQISYA